MIWSHRGGPVWGPENSMKVFQISKEQQVEAVECDIWMSKDGVPMVLHGLGEGNMSQYEGLDENDIVFEWTREELQSKIDIGEG